MVGLYLQYLKAIHNFFIFICCRFRGGRGGGGRDFGAGGGRDFGRGGDRSDFGRGGDRRDIDTRDRDADRNDRRGGGGLDRRGIFYVTDIANSNKEKNRILVHELLELSGFGFGLPSLIYQDSYCITCRVYR